MSKKWKLQANCIPVKGAKRSIICDLHRQGYELIPNDLYTILETHLTFDLDFLVETYGEAYADTLKGYMDFLHQHEFIIACTEEDRLPPLDMNWSSPALIQNAIIDADAMSRHYYPKIIQELEELRCEHIQLRFFYDIDLSELNAIIELFRTSRIFSIQLLLPYNAVYAPQAYLSLVRKELRITEIVVYDAPFNGPQDEVDWVIEKNALYFSTQHIDSETHCGVVHPAYFSVNSEVFRESQKHNNCLNKKIAVDKEGNIKNCPSLPTSFGKVKNTSLKKALNKKAFREHWNTAKDTIEVCCDCEFRYICIDCRAYTKDDHLKGKPSKCTYDPYTAEWK